MIYPLLVGCFLGSLLLILSLVIHLFCRVRFELSDLEIRLLARHIELKAAIKEQIKGGIDFHMRELSQEATKQLIKKAVK